VPCTVVLLGRWNWWPARLSRVSPEPDDTERDSEPAAQPST